MGHLSARLLAGVAGLLLLSSSMLAAQRPTTDQAQRLLQSRPDLVAQLRQRIMTSGMTPDQVRARLRAEGYPETLLDAYLPNGASVADSLPGTDVFAAVRALGIADSTDVERLQRLMRRDSTGAGDPRRADEGTRDAAAEDSARAGTLEIFGLRLFGRETSLFDPNLAGPVDENYRLGPGDQLVLILTGDVEAAYTLDVTREGFVVIPQVGQLPVANLTLGELDNVLYSRLGRAYSGVRRGADATTRFSVSVAKLRSNQVFVVGDVAQPGSYRISSAATVLAALYAAGGPTERGSLRRVEVRRAGRTVDTLDVYDYLLRGDASHDARLETGDVVFVPVHGRRISILGEVVRPAQYELEGDETLADAIMMAGGFSPTASLLRVQIDRIAPPSDRAGEGRSRLVIDVSAPSLREGNAPTFALAGGDVVHVLRIADRVRNRIRVDGSVWQPGAQGFRDGMMLGDALRAAGGLKPDAYLGRVLVSRLLPDSTRIQLRAMMRDTSGAVVDDMALREDDVIQVFSLSDFRPERYVAISGAVRRGGQYPYRDGMTLRDLVLLAGGLEQSAYLKEAELARLPDDRSGGVTATTIRVPLDSSYLFDRGPDGRYLGPPGLPSTAGPTPEQPLLPYDNVLVLAQPDFQLQRSATIGGEIQFPGHYTLRTKGERLRDLIERAGGVTAEGYAEGIEFFRSSDSLGRIGLDLPRVLRDAKDRDNLILEHGDSVFIPRYSPVVNVTGAVNAPVAVSYQPGKGLGYYIQRAGGASRVADARRAFVRQPNGDVEGRGRTLLLFPSEPTPRAGSVVTVPERDPDDRKDYTAIAGSIAQVLASLVAIIVVVRR
jgi:protein involved in polysaccharide export with SLBB domain